MNKPVVSRPAACRPGSAVRPGLNCWLTAAATKSDLGRSAGDCLSARPHERRGVELGPSGRCFVTNSLGYFLLEEPLFSLQGDRLLKAFDRYADDYIIYDEHGFEWKTDGYVTPAPRRHWLLLPFRILFSPWIPVTYVWREPTEYSLDDLKAAYIKAVDMDDDILTQFVDADELIGRIQHARSFASLVEIYRWMFTDHTFEHEDEDEE
jgi:hypothetical protein